MEPLRVHGSDGFSEYSASPPEIADRFNLPSIQINGCPTPQPWLGLGPELERKMAAREMKVTCWESYLDSSKERTCPTLQPSLGSELGLERKMVSSRAVMAPWSELSLVSWKPGNHPTLQTTLALVGMLERKSMAVRVEMGPCWEPGLGSLTAEKWWDGVLALPCLCRHSRGKCFEIGIALRSKYRWGRFDYKGTFCLPEECIV